MGKIPLGLGFKSPLKSIFASMCINMLVKKRQKPRVGTISNHVYFAVTNEVRKFTFVMML
jgi:hypothetical protein